MFLPGQAVLVTGYELGAGHWGGWSQFIRVPADWVVPAAAGVDAARGDDPGDGGLYGGAVCLATAAERRRRPTSGPVVVTGATGGVGSLAVKLLSQLGYQVTASTGKLHDAEWLQRLGARHVIGREDVLTSVRQAAGTWLVGRVPSTRWAAKRWRRSSGRVSVNGCVAACGLVAGAELPLTVYPFILRGVVLAGVSSQNCPMPLRREIWRRLATDWRLTDLEVLVREIDLAGLDDSIRQILAGQIRGRVLVRLSADEAS